LAGGGSFQVEVRPGEVRLLRAGQVVRSYPVPQGYRAQALVVGGRLAVTTEPEQRWDEFQLRVYDVATGRRFAGHTQVGKVSRLYSKGNALFVEYSSAVAEIATRTLVRNLRSAQERTDIDGWRVAENARSLLFNSPNGVYSPYEPVRLNYFRYDVATGRTLPLTLAVPARSGCGPVEKDGTREEGETYTAREIVATRHDGCGAFQARFDWAGDPSNKPVVTPRN